MHNSLTLKNITTALLGAGVVSIAIMGFYTIVEPAISRAVDSGPFTVQQTITDEISFSVDAGNVTMDGPISGLTGGNATGTTYAVVETNDALGYNMTISFDTDAAMQADTGSDFINNYKPAAAGVPDNVFVASTSAVFAYTITASSSGDVDPTFRDDGAGACAAGANNNADVCWYGPVGVAAEFIINRPTSAPTGATTSIKFKVNVPNGPSPTIDAGVYTATATLTALNN